MFDRTTYKTESKVVAVTQQIEKTISPDKVTDMYDKVREQAEKDIIASLRVENNILNGVVVQIADQYDTATSRLYTRFQLNGKDYTDMYVVPTREARTMADLYSKLEEHYTRVVQRSIFREIAPAFTKAIFPRI